MHSSDISISRFSIVCYTYHKFNKMHQYWIHSKGWTLKTHQNLHLSVILLIYVIAYICYMCIQHLLNSDKWTINVNICFIKENLDNLVNLLILTAEQIGIIQTVPVVVILHITIMNGLNTWIFQSKYSLELRWMNFQHYNE